MKERNNQIVGIFFAPSKSNEFKLQRNNNNNNNNSNNNNNEVDRSNVLRGVLLFLGVRKNSLKIIGTNTSWLLV